VPQKLDLAPFRPSKAQSVAKAKLQAYLASKVGLVGVEAMTKEELTTVTGDRRVGRWLLDPEFAAWLTDRDTFVTQAAALKEASLQVLEDILLGDLDPKLLTAKDKLKAIDLLWQLTGAYPKHTQVRFLDRDLDALTEDEVDRQLLAKGMDPAKLGR
jgi:hypothetical protein